jgi:uncharacterized protein
VAHPIVYLRKAYKALVSPWLGPRCRFYPSCSEYCAQAVSRFGWLRGGWLTLTRICRCHPLADFGLDAVPEHFSWREHALGTRPLPAPEADAAAHDCAVVTQKESAKLSDPRSLK